MLQQIGGYPCCHQINSVRGAKEDDYNDDKTNNAVLQMEITHDFLFVTEMMASGST